MNSKKLLLELDENEENIESFLFLLDRIVASNREMIETLQSSLQAALLFGLNQEEVNSIRKPLEDLRYLTSYAEEMVRKLKSK